MQQAAYHPEVGKDVRNKALLYGIECTTGYIDLLEHVLLVSGRADAFTGCVCAWVSVINLMCLLHTGPAETHGRTETAVGRAVQESGGLSHRAHPDCWGHERWARTNGYATVGLGFLVPKYLSLLNIDGATQLVWKKVYKFESQTLVIKG